jgi:cation transport ATPase
MDTITRSVFLIENIRHKEKAQWLKRIIRSQIGVLRVSVNPSNMLMKVEYDANAITPSMMQMLIRSVGCELLIDEEQIHNRLRQKGRLKRDIISLIVSTFLFALSFLTWSYSWGYIAVATTGIIFLTFLVILIKEQRRKT